MPQTKLKFTCGCGFQTAVQIEAEKHAVTHDHVLHAYGVTKPLKPKWAKPLVTTREWEQLSRRVPPSAPFGAGDGGA